MIFTDVEKLKDYVKIYKSFSKIFDFTKKNNLEKIECGVYDLGGGEYVNIVKGKGMDNDGIMESHRKYTDVQMIICGEEKLLLAAIDDCVATTEYNAADDYTLYTCKEPSDIKVKSGYVAVLFPEDVHKMFVENKSGTSKKAIFKLKV